jgi:EAL domain-containing protein (putative c-di-GMP-specific phosphodiesterase class I)
VVESRTLGLDIERALLQDEFEPFFQPQFDARTLELSGVEALARWRHPTRGVLVPYDFMKIADQRSAIDRIDAMIFRKGLEAIAKLNRQGLFIPKVSFNVVASQLENPDLPKRVERQRLGGTKVCFEVLESVLVEEQSSSFRFHIDNLKEQGFGIEVDDFGSGHASIIGLMQLSPDTMKIDQRLIFPIVESSAARQMVEAILEIAQAIDISVTAEGVETAEHAAILSSMGCDTLQGYHFAKPMASDAFATFLSNYRPEAQKTGRMARG